MTIATQNFCPNSAYVISATTTTSNTALTQPPSLGGPTGSGAATGAAGQVYGGGNAGGYNTVIVYNAAAKVAYLQFGMAAQTATAGSPYQVAPGAIMTFDLPGPMTNVGVILESGASAANVYIMLGGGA
jgi:hypothetical protein